MNSNASWIFLFLTGMLLFVGSTQADDPFLSNIWNCEVVSAHGHFLGYSVPPSPGDKTRLDFQTLLNERGEIRFETVRESAPPKPYIPFSVPFKVTKIFKMSDGTVDAVRLHSEDNPRSGVIIEASRYGADDSRSMISIRVEAQITTAMAFMVCSEI